MIEMPDDTKPCTCGKLMILRFTGQVLASYPAQYPTNWFCGGCGRLEKGPTIRGKLHDEMAMKRWIEVNKPEEEK